MSETDHEQTPTSSRNRPLRLDGSSLTLAQIEAVADHVEIDDGSDAAGQLVVDTDALTRMHQTYLAAERLSRSTPVYGRTTGVGAARDQSLPAVTAAGSDDPGLRLLRSHAAGWGEQLPRRSVRAGLLIRANQLLAAGSGAAPQLAVALAEAAAGSGAQLPVVHRGGGLGTGDLTALAEVGLALAGERPRADGGRVVALPLGLTEALPLLSSNAFTLADAALGVLELQRLSRAATVVIALSWVALRGNVEAVSQPVEVATPFPGAISAARSVRALLEPEALHPLHIQDFFGLRTWPQVQGPFLDALSGLDGTIRLMVNAPSENPLFTMGSDESSDRVSHHGGFHAAYLALGVDGTLLALTRAARSSTSRTAHLLADRTGGLPLFLAGSTVGASGLLIGEYVAGAALGEIRGLAGAPVSTMTATLSADVEDDASFAALAVSRLAPAAAAYRRVLAVELVCSVRALRMRNVTMRGPLRRALTTCDVLSAGTEDRDVSEDFALAESLLVQLAALEL